MPFARLRVALIVLFLSPLFITVGLALLADQPTFSNDSTTEAPDSSASSNTYNVVGIVLAVLGFFLPSTVGYFVNAHRPSRKLARLRTINGLSRKVFADLLRDNRLPSAREELFIGRMLVYVNCIPFNVLAIVTQNRYTLL